jgi:citrate synthase
MREVESVRILEQKREQRLIRPTAKYAGPPPRPLPSHAR